jgi:phosphoribosylaminoimidazolecarboxamide formyltransferase / IMP cyclohydrolase
MQKIKRALISVWDKTGLEPLVKVLNELDVEIISTGGTLKKIMDLGIHAKAVDDVTGFPEMMDGRVKTLHPKIHGGLLARRDVEAHLEKAKEHGIGLIDLVVVNLYPFEMVAAKTDATTADVIENIDIGGPSMLRSAAKNNAAVAVVCNPGSYDALIAELKENGGGLSDETRQNLAVEVFRTTAKYDAAIAAELDKRFSAEEKPYPKVYQPTFNLIQSLRYGENPHQWAAFYSDGQEGPGVGNAKQLQGKELSFNNIIDINAALNMVLEYQDCACSIIKHTNPCGAALGKTPAEAFKAALETDPVSSFGSVIGFNRIVDLATAEAIGKLFVEAIIAPGFDDEAKAKFAKKKNLRLLEVGDITSGVMSGMDMKKVDGGLLIQEKDIGCLNEETMTVPTKRKPTDDEMAALKFVWPLTKHVKSNAIVYANSKQLVGVGAGQMSRVDSAKIAAMKANLPLEGTVVGSDAFFPFRDGIDVIAEAGATAIIQPGGSMRDEEVIEACNEHGIAMVFAGMRHFKH